jgi:hypothetical protein
MQSAGMPMDCAQCGVLTPIEELEPVYLGLNAFGRETYGLLCKKCRRSR